MLKIESLIADGQPGVGRAVLDFALTNDISYTGWVPKDGQIPDYRGAENILEEYSELKENNSKLMTSSVKKNIEFADAVLIVKPRRSTYSLESLVLSGSDKYKKPLYMGMGRDREETLAWLDELEEIYEAIKLYITGPIAHESSRSYGLTYQLLNYIYQEN